MNIVERLTLDNYEEILKNIKLKKPFIINTDLNLIEGFNQFLAKCEHEKITILKYTSNEGTRKDCLTQTMTISEYLNGEYISSGWFISSNFINNNLFKEYESKLLGSDNTLCKLIKLRESKVTNLWLSPRDKFSGLHYDYVDNFNFQIFGRKTYFIAPPQVKEFYVGKVFDQKYHHSNINDIFNYNRTKFPAFSGNISKFYQVDTNNGDLLYIPAFWWHQVYTKDYILSANINWWYLDRKMLWMHPKSIVSLLSLSVYRKIFQKHLRHLV